MLPPVRYGVIGAGRMAETTMLQLMDAHPAAVAKAFYEIDPELPANARCIERLKEKGIRSCSSLEALLACDDVDAILNCTPHYAHAETSIAALASGKPVICEKPPASSREDCQAMIAAARSAAAPMLVHFQHVLRPGARWLSKLLTSGELGAIRRVRCLSLWWRNAEYFHRVPWAGKRTFDGRATLDGAMVNQTVHYINQMLSVAERGDESHIGRVASLRAELFRFNSPDDLEMEDTAVIVATLDNADRTEVVFAGSNCAEGSAGENRVSEYGGRTMRHQVVLECEHGTARWWGPAEVRFNDGRELSYAQPEGHWPFYFHIQQVLAGHEPPVTPIDQSARTMDFIFDAYDDAGPIHQVRRDRLAEIEPVLIRCFEQTRLPSELGSPPDWPAP